MMAECLVFSPTTDARKFKAANGNLVSPPVGWERLPPGDAGLTRRVKAAGPSWQIVEKKRNKTFSHGLWAPSCTAVQR